MKFRNQVDNCVTINDLQALLKETSEISSEDFNYWGLKLNGLMKPATATAARLVDGQLQLDYAEEVYFVWNGQQLKISEVPTDLKATICPRHEYGKEGNRVGFIPLTGSKNDKSWKLGTVVVTAEIASGPITNTEVFVGTVGERMAHTIMGDAVFEVSQQQFGRSSRTLRQLAREVVFLLWGYHAFQTQDPRTEIQPRGNLKDIKEYRIASMNEGSSETPTALPGFYDTETNKVEVIQANSAGAEADTIAAALQALR